MNIQEFEKQANEYGRKNIPFFFLIDFECRKLFLCKLEDSKTQKIYYKLQEKSNYSEKNFSKKKIKLLSKTISIEKYKAAFDTVKKNILNGNTYLLNLTFPSELQNKYSLLDFYTQANADYKLYFKNKFTLFSPECFIKTHNNTIFSYPMKGTVNADIPNAEKVILENRKENWEHNTIVDLIRNDLALVSNNIQVIKFKFITKIKSSNKDLLQMSSEIKGSLSDNWQYNIGSILLTLLPAGSVSGAPKLKTVELISEIENSERGYYTGVFGVFDGKDIDSAVNIRYIENMNGKLIFRSGGGITSNSELKFEYDELKNKIYIPHE